MSKKRGFTIIEVVLVLAIAGLIFMMVFIALPSLRRAQRDTQRKNNLSSIVASMNDWYKHNSKSVTDVFGSRNSSNGFCTFYKRYVGDELKDPRTGEPYKVALWNSTNVTNCKNGKTYNRGEFDNEVSGTRPDLGKNDAWAKMEVGDIQYNDGAICDGEYFSDDIGRGKSNGYKIFAFRIKLENGSTLCMDNGNRR